MNARSRIVLPLPDDFHVHLRQDAEMGAYARTAARRFGRVLVMPNTSPAIETACQLDAYRRDIEREAPGLKVLPVFKITTRHTFADVAKLAEVGAFGAKVYPEGVTTNSEDGIFDLRQLWPILPSLEDHGMVLCCHGEKPGVFCLDREERFLEEFTETAERFPRLRLVLEHVSTAAAVRRVRELGSNVAATITLHHLETTLDDVVGGLLNPHVFCKPIPKRPEDRESLRDVVAERHPRFFFGSDSAPHRRDRKECAAGCAGVYTMPVALEGLADLFERLDLLDRLPDFVASFGARFHGLPLPTGSITLERQSWVVPALVDGAVPFRTGETLAWSLGDRTP